MPVSSEIAIIAGPGTQVGPLGQKSRARSVQNAFGEGSGQSSLAGRLNLAVKVMEPTQQRSLWRSLSCFFPVRSAPLTNGMRVSENHPRKTHGF